MGTAKPPSDRIEDERSRERLDRDQRIERVNKSLGGFRSRLDARMREQGINAAQLARASGADPGSLSRFLTLGKLPSTRNLALIADALDCSADHLLGID